MTEYTLLVKNSIPKATFSKTEFKFLQINALSSYLTLGFKLHCPLVFRFCTIILLTIFGNFSFVLEKKRICIFILQSVVSYLRLIKSFTLSRVT